MRFKIPRMTKPVRISERDHAVLKAMSQIQRVPMSKLIESIIEDQLKISPERQYADTHLPRFWWKEGNAVHDMVSMYIKEQKKGGK